MMMMMIRLLLFRQLVYLSLSHSRDRHDAWQNAPSYNDQVSQAPTQMEDSSGRYCGENHRGGGNKNEVRDDVSQKFYIESSL
jgi:hypothetical protein